jgi:hypothetical protein
VGALNIVPVFVGDDSRIIKVGKTAQKDDLHLLEDSMLYMWLQ